MNAPKLTPTQAQNIADWLQSAVDRVEYGTVNIEIVVHAGQIKFVEKKVSEKVHGGDL